MTTLMRNTLSLLLACILPTLALGQESEKPASAVQRCAPAKSFKAPQLYGAWRIELPAVKQTGTMTLRQHPEFTESLRGELRYGDTQSIASGDLEEGEFNLDESSDRIGITAIWTGKLVESSCGREIRGEWQDSRKGTTSPFVLRRESGW